MSKSKCYRTLGVSPRASLEEIKRRFRQLALRYHPDRTGGKPAATSRFLEIAEAYQILCQGTAPNSTSEKPEGPAEGRRRYYQRRAFDPDEWLNDFFGTKEETVRGPRREGADFRYDLQIPLAAVAQGLTQEITFARFQSCCHCHATGREPGTGQTPCPDCGGQGRLFKNPGQLRLGPLCTRCQGRGMRPTQPCAHCGGIGMQELLRRYRIHIPPGVEDGARILIAGEGGEGFRQGPPGRLVVVIHIEPDEFFTRIINDLYCRVEVPFAQAARGACIQVPTLNGNKMLQIPQGTLSGQIFRWTGLGLPGKDSRSIGDQIIEIVIATPQEGAWDQGECLPGSPQTQSQAG